MKQLLVYVHPRSLISVVLLEALLNHVRVSDGVEVAAVIDAAPSPASSLVLANLRLRTATVVKRLFGAGCRAYLAPVMFMDACAVARANGVPVVVPPDRDINHRGHVEVVRREFSAPYAVSLACLQIFRQDLLSSFSGCLNYHNGRLPDYRGLSATAWSIYSGESETGYSFHRMEEGIDTGPVLLAGELAIDREASAMEMEHRKSLAAARDLPRALKMFLASEVGTVQASGGRYYSQAARAQFCRISDPGEHSLSELVRRLRAFEVLEIAVGNVWMPVTGLKPADSQSGSRDAYFVECADGAAVITRCMYMPPSLYRVIRMFAGPSR